MRKLAVSTHEFQPDTNSDELPSDEQLHVPVLMRVHSTQRIASRFVVLLSLAVNI